MFSSRDMQSDSEQNCWINLYAQFVNHTFKLNIIYSFFVEIGAQINVGI
jgi:hypothetical protein